MKSFLFLIKKGVIFFGVFILFNLFVSSAQAATRYAVANSDWNLTSTWSASSGGASGASVPVAGDTVYIGESSTARTVTIPTGYTAECAILYLGEIADINKKAGTLTFATSSSALNVSGNVVIHGPLGGATRVINVNAGTMTVGGNLELGTGQTGNQSNRVSKVVITTGVVTVNGNLTYNNIAGSSPLQTSIDMSGGSGTFNLKGAFTISNSLGTLIPGATSTFNFNGTVAQTIPIGVSSVVYNNLNINNTNASGATLSAAISATNVTGNISIGNISPGSLFNTGNFAIVRGASKTLTVASGSTINAGTSVIEFSATGVVTIDGIFKTANTVGFSGGAGTTAISSTNTPTITLGGSSTIEYSSGSAQVVTARSDYANLTFSGAGAKTTASGTTTVAGNWSVTGGTATLNTNNSSITVTGNITGTGAITSGSGTISLAGNWTNNGTFTADSGTVNYNKAGAQTVGAVTYNNLTLSGSGAKTAANNFTVNGILNLSVANPSATVGLLDMSTYTLTMGGSATTVGAGDVIGIVKRTTIIANTPYTFGNQYTIINFENIGTLPSDISVKTTIGSAPTWKAGAVKRIYEEARTGGSGSYATINFHYLDSELNGNTENILTKWASLSPFVTTGEDGRSNYDTTNNWVGVTGFDVSFIPTSFGLREVTLADTAISSVTWNGSVSTSWSNSANWSPNGVPSDLADVIIPDASTTPNDPILNPALAIGRLTIQSGGILNTDAGYAPTVTVSGGSGAWSNNGGTFNAGTGATGSTIVFTNASASVSGTTNFYNLTINSGANLGVGSNAVMRIGGTIINNGIWDVGSGSYNIIEYNGAAQTVLEPNGTGNRYNHLILSGTGAKTMPVTTLAIIDDFTMSGTATATAGAVINIGGNFTVGPTNTFTMGAYSDSIGGSLTNNGTFTATGATIGIGGDFTNNNTFTATGSTITFNGTVAQAIGGTTDPVFSTLNISNTTAPVTATANFSTSGLMTVISGAPFYAGTSVISGGGTFTLASGGILGIGSTAGISSSGATGNIQTTIRNFNTGANYIYNGTANQATGNGLPATVNGLAINNTGGAGNNTVTLGGTKTVNGALTLTSGYFATGANNLYISSTGSVSGGSAGSHVVGNLKKYIATGGTNKTFEIGDGTNYTPVDIAFGNVTSANDLTMTTASGDCSTIGSSIIDPSKTANRCWTATDAGIAFNNYNAVFHFINPGDLDGGANTANFIVGKYSGSWSYPTIGIKNSADTQATGLTSFSDFQLGEASNTAPNVPTLVSPSNGLTINDNTPTLSANYSDPDTGDTGTTNYRISSGTAQNCLDNTNIVAFGTSSATASNNENTTWTTGGSIGGDQTYYWCAQNDDGVAQSAWTSMGNFILDTNAPTFTMQYYSDSGLTTTISDNAKLKAGTYYIKISANEALGSTPTVSIAAEGTANDITDGATTLVSGNDYKYTRTISSDAAAVGSVLENWSITGTDAVGNTATNVDPTNEATKVMYTDTTAPTNQDTVFATSSSVAGGASVTVVSSGDATNTIWFAPSGTTTFIAGATMTTAGGTAISILAPATAGDYRMFVIDAAGNISSQSTAILTVTSGQSSSISYTPVNIPMGGFSVVVNNGVSAVDNGVFDVVDRSVDLKFNAGPDVVRMAISNLPDLSDAGQEPYQSIKDWTLTPGSGLKTVYVKFYNSTGQSSPIIKIIFMLNQTQSLNSEDILTNIFSESQILNTNNRDILLFHLNNEFDTTKEQAGLIKYNKILELDKNISAIEKITINYFIVYGTQTTQRLGAGERAAVINSYFQAYNKLPNSKDEWSDALKIANGRWTKERSAQAEAQAKIEFKRVYIRDANLEKNIDENAIMVIAYGLLPLNRNLDSERTAINTFKWVYKHNPVNALAWNIVRAIAYSGAKR